MIFCVYSSALYSRLKEIDNEINRGLIVYIPQVSIKRLKEKTMIFIEEILSIYLLRYLSKASGNRPRDPWRTCCLYSFLDIYQKLKEIEGNRPWDQLQPHRLHSYLDIS